MAKICIGAIVRAVKFNGELLHASLPTLSVLNLHEKSLMWSLALGIYSYCSGAHGAAEKATGKRLKEEDGAELQCVICLCDVCKGEIYRILPGCNHGFHVSCIDSWLQTHSTCPLCRCPVPFTSAKKTRNDEAQQLIDSILSHFHSFLDHVCTWFVNPLGFELTSTLSEDYRSVL